MPWRPTRDSPRQPGRTPRLRRRARERRTPGAGRAIHRAGRGDPGIRLPHPLAPPAVSFTLKPVGVKSVPKGAAEIFPYHSASSPLTYPSPNGRLGAIALNFVSAFPVRSIRKTLRTGRPNRMSNPPTKQRHTHSRTIRAQFHLGRNDRPKPAATVVTGGIPAERSGAIRAHRIPAPLAGKRKDPTAAQQRHRPPRDRRRISDGASNHGGTGPFGHQAPSEAIRKGGWGQPDSCTHISQCQATGRTLFPTYAHHSLHPDASRMRSSSRIPTLDHQPHFRHSSHLPSAGRAKASGRHSRSTGRHSGNRNPLATLSCHPKVQTFTVPGYG